MIPTRRPYLIGIAGPSCSGKSSVAHAIMDLVPGSTLIAADSYYRDLAHLAPAERAAINFDDPEAIEHELLAAQLAELLAGRDVDCPCYDFTEHLRTPQVRRHHSRPLLVVEGLYVLHWPEVRELLDLSIFLEADHETCLRRRLRRDVEQRGRSREFVVEQYERDVRPMCERYLLPSGQHARVFIDGTLPLAECVRQAQQSVAQRLLVSE